MEYRIEFLSGPHALTISFSECAELLCYLPGQLRRQRQYDWFLNMESCSEPGYRVGRELFKIDGVTEMFKLKETFSITVKCDDTNYDSYEITDYNSDQFLKECSRFVNLTALNENFLNEWDDKIQKILIAVKSCCSDGVFVDMEWKKYINEPNMRKYDCKTRHHHKMIEGCYLISNI